MSAQAQLLNPSARGARRFEHYPRGLHGPYVASPWAAARLGKRIFASRAEYHLWVRADYAPTGHHHPAAIAARIEEREARVALENAARWRQAVWDGVDPEAPMYVQPRVEIRKRQARANLRGGTGKGIRRCVRTQEEEAIVSNPLVRSRTFLTVRSLSPIYGGTCTHASRSVCIRPSRTICIYPRSKKCTYLTRKRMYLRRTFP